MRLSGGRTSEEMLLLASDDLGAITDWVSTGWQMPSHYSTPTLLLARPTRLVVGLGHAAPPVEWLAERGAGRQLCMRQSSRSSSLRRCM